VREAVLTATDRRLATESLWSVRRQRSLDALIDQLGKRKPTNNPPDLRTLLHFLQLRYLSQIPDAAAVNSTVGAKENGFSGLSGFVNGLLRQYIRLAENSADPSSCQKIQLSAWVSYIAILTGLWKCG